MTDGVLLVMLGCLSGALVQCIAWLFIQRYVRGQKDQRLDDHDMDIKEIRHDFKELEKDVAAGFRGVNDRLERVLLAVAQRNGGGRD